MENRSGGYLPTYESTDTSQRHFRRNFGLGVINGGLYIGGLAFCEPATVLPVFVSLFTGSSVLIGLTGTLTSVGWLLPQLAVARYVEHLPQKMRLYAIAAAFRTASWMGLVISVMWADNLAPGAYLVVFFACLGSFSLFGGVSGIAFLDIVAKTIPPGRRGRYFGYRRFLASIMAAAAGIVVSYVLGNPDRFPFPGNYCVLFSLTFIFLVMAVVSFLCVVEPRGSVKPARERTSGEYLSQVRLVLSQDRAFRNFLSVMVLASTMSLSLPFYVIYATEVLGAPTSWVGIFVTVDMLANLVATLAWGYLGDAKGYRTVIRMCTVVCMATPVLALMSPSYLAFTLVFVLRGSGSTGLWIGKNNYLLEIAPVIRRPTYIGIVNTTLAFVMLLPVVGGIVVDLSSYAVLFAITAVLLLVSTFRASSLVEPRAISNRPPPGTAGSGP